MILHDSLSALGRTEPLVSVIMPVFNTQDFVALAIESVLNQTYKNLELICVDDGSEDESANIIRSYMMKDNRIQLIQIENHGQGYVRNMAARMAKGEYIQFLDADDYLSPYTLDLAVARAEKDGSDLVVYDWFYYEPLGKVSKYVNKDEFFSRPVLKGRECLELLKITPYFTVNKLYRKSFLLENNVVYGENYIYEDIPFWAKVSLKANLASLIHSPLYRVTINNNSTTKTNLGTDRHCRGFILATEEISRDFKENEATEEARYYIFNYLLQKFAYYYTARTPKELKAGFARDFVYALSEFDVTDLGLDAYTSQFLKKDVFRKKDYRKFGSMIDFLYVKKPRMKKLYVKVTTKFKNGIKKLLKLLHLRKNHPSTLNDKYLAETKKPLYGDVILFMGFDYRYTGNSRYLFEQMIKHPTNKKLFFITDDVRVPFEYRIKPHTERANRFIARAKTIIFESWPSPNLVKRAGTNWIQLWHGTPLKKMLFDTHEKTVYERNPEQKISKFKGIANWDYLIVDNPSISSYFETCFLIPRHRIIPSGYPRVKYLLDNYNDESFKSKLKEKYGFPKDKKLVLYLPTWRDYNYKTEEGELDISYLLDPARLNKELGEDYLVVYKDHAFLSNSKLVDYPNYDTAETQELLLIADYLITDYSSVMFDAFSIDVPVVIYCKDFERNEEERGVYDSIWEDIKPLNCESLGEVVEAIRNYKHQAVCESVKRKYSYQSECSLQELIFSL